MALIQIPSLMRDLTGNQETVKLTLSAEPVSVRDVLTQLDERFPGFTQRLLYEDDLMPGMAVFVDGEQSLLGLRQKVTDQSQIDFIPPAVGG